MQNKHMMEFYFNTSGSDEKKAVGNSRIKVMNRSEILKVLLYGGQNSRAEIARITKLSSPTVTRIVNELLAEGLVWEVGTSQTNQRGQPPSMLAFNKEIGYVIGVDIGESFISFALADLAGNILEEIDDISTKAKLGEDATLNQIICGFHRFTEKYSIPKDMIKGMCVGVPGLVSNDGRVNAPDIINWWRYPLRDKLSDALGIEIVLENSQNLGVVGEYFVGSAQGKRDVVYINFRAGIGAGIMVNGQLHRGINNAAGEVGFMLHDKDAQPLNKDGHGAVETVIGLGVIVDKLTKAGESLENQYELPYLREIFQKAADGNPRHMAVAEEASRYYGQIVVNLISVLNPELVILGGDIHPLGDFIQKKIEWYVDKFIPYPPEIILSTMGSKAVLNGAVQVILKLVHMRLGIER